MVASLLRNFLHAQVAAESLGFVLERGRFEFLLARFYWHSTKTPDSDGGDFASVSCCVRRISAEIEITASSLGH
jgi:hypothetical protein